MTGRREKEHERNMNTSCVESGVRHGSGKTDQYSDTKTKGKS